MSGDESAAAAVRSCRVCGLHQKQGPILYRCEVIYLESIGLKLINWDAFCAEEEQIEQLADASERAARHQLLDAIWEKITDWDAHVLDYTYAQHCKQLVARGIRFTPVKRAAVMAKWSRLFAATISKADKKRVHYEQFKWHLFSFNLLEALQQDAARQAFNACPKSTVYLFFQCSDDAYLVENASLLEAADFEIDSPLSKSDIFIFDDKAKWTYSHTHEESCGPYFYCAK